MADTKNYGLKGVGDDVQFGKAGGRFVYNTGASDFRATDSGGSTLVHLQVLDPVGDTDAATKLYVDDVASGLDVKASVTCASTADVSGTYNATAGPNANGQHTGVPAAIDGVTLAQGDRVLLKNQSPADENGIYEVQATTTTLNRASDFDTDAEVTAGAFTFVEEGTTNADSGWVLQGPDPLTVGTGGGSNLNFVLFSTSSDIVAGTGLLKTGNVLDLDFSQLTSAAVIAGADELIFQDAGVESRITVTNFLADRDIVTISANGIVTRTAADTYAARTITASATASEEGVVITNGNGVAGNPTIGLDIQGTTSAGTDATNTDELILFDGTNNRAYSVLELSAAPAFATAAVTQIIAGDTSITATDTGSDGTLTTVADGATVIVTDDTGSTFTVDSATTNADIPVITVSATSSGTPLAGIGPSIQFQSETAAGAPGNQEIGGLIASEATDVTGASEDFDFVFSTMAGGTAAAERMRISSLGIVTAPVFSGDLTIDGSSFVTVDTAGQFTDDDVTLMTAAAVNDRIESFGYSTTTGTVTSSGTPLNNQVAVFTTGTDIDSNANFTWDAAILALTGAMDITGDLDVDNINLNLNTISTTTGNLIIQSTGTSSVIINDGGGDPILELNNTVSAINGLAISAGATGNPAQITTGTGSEANIDIGFLTNGTGAIAVVAGSGNYEDNVTADDDIPNKKYVDDAISAGAVSGALDTVTGTVDLTTASTQNIGAAAGIPASCTIMSVMLEVDTASDAATTVTVGDATNGAASYMAATENDPEILDIYIADGRVANAAATRQATATVAVQGTVGAATCIITFRHA